jgi:hypothetical protein
MLSKLIKIASGLSLLLCITALIIYLIAGIDAIGEYFNFDPDNFHLIETDRERTLTYIFSLRERIYYLLIGILLLAVISSIALLKSQELSFRIKTFATFIKQYSSTTFYEIKGSKVKYFLLIPLAAYIYYACTAPITHDEATTYTKYTVCSFLNTMAGYTLPNNHVLFSLIEHFFIEIPFIDLLFKFRLPSIIIALLTWTIAYRFVRKYSNENTAITVVAIASTVYMIFQYSFFARGYSLLVLFCVVCLYTACNIIYNNNRLRDWTIFSTSGILGFYTMPSFLYFFFTINVFILLLNWKNITKQIYFNLWIITGVFLLYLPVFVVLGWQALSGNYFVKPLDRGYVVSELFPFFSMCLRQFFAIPPYLLTPALLGLVLYTIYTKKKKTLILWLVCLITPFFLLTVHSVIPFHRTFVYYGFLLVFLSAISIKDILKNIPLKILIGVLLAIQAFQIYRFQNKLDHLMTTYAEYDSVIESTIENDKTYITNASFLYPNFLFEIDRCGYNSSIDQNLVPINSDTLHRYDIILLDSLSDTTQKRKPKQSIKDFRNIPINIYHN